MDPRVFNKLKEKHPVREVIEEEGGLDVEGEEEYFVKKASLGFEIGLIMVMDDADEERKMRKGVLDRRNRYMGVAQVDHAQYDKITCVIMCSHLKEMGDTLQ